MWKKDLYKFSTRSVFFNREFHTHTQKRKEEKKDEEENVKEKNAARKEYY